MQPTTIHELVLNDTSAIDTTRSSNLSPGTCYWNSRNLPASGKGAMDSSVGGYNCEVIQFEFSGHGAGNYVTNFKYYTADRNSVAQDMTHFVLITDTFTAPSTFADADIYNYTSDWSDAELSLPGTVNVATSSAFTATQDPTKTQLIYNSVVVEAAKTTGTGSWGNVLMYQYT